MNIGWDIGIKNLAYCIIDDDSNIKDWGIIDITDNEEYKCGFVTQKRYKINILTHTPVII